MDNELTETLSLSPDGCDTETEVVRGAANSDGACFAEAAVEPNEEDEACLGDPAVRRKARYRPVDGRAIKTTLSRALDDGGRQDLNAVLIDFSAGGARVFADECVPFEEPVGLLIDFDGRHRVDVTGQVRWIRSAEGGGALLGLSLTPQPSQKLLDDLSRERILERRDAVRMPYGKKAHVQWESSLSDEAVVVRDVSSDGLSMQCEIPPQVGRRGVIRVRLASGERAAITVEVRWQSHDGDSAVVGCAIHDGPVELLLTDAAREAAILKEKDREPSPSWIARAAWTYVITCGLLGAAAAWSLLAGLPQSELQPNEEPLEITPVASTAEKKQSDLKSTAVAKTASEQRTTDQIANSPSSVPAGRPAPVVEAASERPALVVPAPAALSTTTGPDSRQPSLAPKPPLDATERAAAAPSSPTYDRLAPEAHYLKAHELYLAERKAEAASELITALRLERLRPISPKSWDHLTSQLAEPGRGWLEKQRAALLGD